MRVKPREIILAYKRFDSKAYEAASQLGIHPATVYRWVERARSAYGNISSKNLRRKSTKPKNSKRFEFSSNQRIKIEELRRVRGWMAEKIRKHLNLACHPRALHRYFWRLTFYHCSF